MYNVICCGNTQPQMILVDKKYDINICVDIFTKFCRYRTISYGGNENIKLILNSSFNEDDWILLSKLYKSNIAHLNKQRCISPINYWYCERHDRVRHNNYLLSLDQETINFLFMFWDENFTDNDVIMAKSHITEVYNNKIIKDIIE